MNQIWLFLFQSTLFLLYNIGFIIVAHRFCIRHFAYTDRHKKSLLLFPPIVFLIVSFIINMIGLSGMLPYPVGSLIPFFSQGLFILWTVVLYRAGTNQKILAASILLATSLLLQNFIGSFLCILLLIIPHALHVELTPFISRILDCLTECLVFAGTIRCISFLSKHMTNFFTGRLHRWYNMLSIPFIGVIVLWNFVSIGASHGILFRGSDHLNLYYNQIFSHVGICILALLCMCGLSFYLFGMDRIDIEQKKKEQYRSHAAFYQMLEEQYRNLERLRHDLKNHVIGLQRLIDNCEWDKLSDYLHKMADFGDIEYADDLTGKRIVDAIVYYKHQQAKEDCIRWECSVHVPPECPIDDFDLCIIFGNLLDNALEACKKLPEEFNPFIHVHAYMVKKCLLIEVVNSMKAASGMKRSDYSYGTGLRNVKDVLDKYSGTLHINTDDHTFRISLLVPCNPAAYDVNQSV